MSGKRRKKGYVILFFLILIGFVLYLRFMPLLKVVYFGSGKEIVEKIPIRERHIFRLNTDLLVKRMLQDKRLKKVKIFRMPWGTALCYASLRTPVAVYKGKNAVYGVDKRGVIFPAGENNDTLPVLSGEKEVIMLGITLLREVKGLKNLRLERDGPVSRMNGYTVMWGRSHYREKAKKVKYLIKAGLPRGEFDLRFGRIIIYREEVHGG